MKRVRSIATAVAAGTVVLGTVLGTLAQTPEGRSPSTQPTTQRSWERGDRANPGGPGAPPVSLERAMKQMNQIVKGIDRQIDDPTKDAATLSLVNGLQAATVAAKNLYPDEIGEKTGDAKTQAINDYRARMIALLRSEISLEEAVLRGDRKAAREVLASLGQQRKDGHDAYGVDDEHHR